MEGYIRDSWYPASWSEALGREPIPRTFLGEEIVLYRCENGQPVALSNTCPHRFARLSKGKLHGDSLACPYHGLRFGPGGTCVHNPHGGPLGSLRIESYPLAERYGMVWIWMGDPATADPALLPQIPKREDERYDWVEGLLHVGGNYQLVIDNLLDLTHVEFMHPFLADTGNEGRLAVECFGSDDQVISRYTHESMARSQLVAALWDDAPERISLYAEMRWAAPANLVHDNAFGSASSNDPPNGELKVPFCHLLTPETATTTHYFWATGRNMKRGNGEVSQALAAGIEATFQGEDEPMIADIQRHMGTRELMEMKPLLLPIDKSAVLARRHVTARIEAERKRKMPIRRPR